MDNPNECPYCESGDLDSRAKEWDDDIIIVPIECEDCGASWSEIYSLTGAGGFERGNV